MFLSAKERLYLLLPIAIVLLISLEIVLALWGPMAFTRKPSLMIGHPFAAGVEEEERDAVYKHIERSLAKTKLLRIISHGLIEDFYSEKRDLADFAVSKELVYTDYMEIAKDLGLERLAISTVFGSLQQVDIVITVRQVDTGDTFRRFSYRAQDVESFIAGRGIDGEKIDLTGDFRESTKAVSLFDSLFFAFLGIQLLCGMLLVLRKDPDILVQIAMALGFLLFAFAYIYAKNASMEYVQRFIANEGRINLADSTAREQLYTAIRFLPLLLINMGLFLLPRIKQLRHDMKSDGSTKVPGAGIVPLITRWGLPLVVLSALLYSFAFPSELTLAGLPYLAWFALVPLFLVITYCRVGYGIFYGIVFGAFQALILNYWHGTYSYISLAFSVLITSGFYTIWTILLVPVTKGLGKWGFLAFPVFWVAFEYARSLGYIGYPWGYLGASQYQILPLIQIADIGGIWAVSFVIAMVNAGIGWTVAAFASNWRLFKRRWSVAAITGAFVVLVFSYGAVRMIVYRTPSERSIRVALTQQNTDPRKHDYPLSFGILTDLTDRAIAESVGGPDGKVPDLIVWPEGGFKPDLRYWLDYPPDRHEHAALVQRLLEYQRSIGTWLVTGTQDHEYREDTEGKRIRRNFNSSLMLSPDGEIHTIYHKMHLVPFTEHFPFKEEFPALYELLDKFDTSDWEQGTERVIYQHPKARFFTPICFEDIFPNDARLFVKEGADLIVNMSNDYWSLTPVEGKQHAVHSLFRAVENRRPMVRSTASGLTTYITKTGRLSREFPAYYTADYIIVDIPIDEPVLTVYTRWGDWLPLMCMAMVALLIIGTGVAAVYMVVRRKTPAAS